MVSIFKRSNGIYYILYEQDGKRKWKSTLTSRRPEALQALVEFQTGSESAAPSSPLLDQFTAEFLTYAKSSFARKTVELYKLSLTHLSAFLGNKALGSISTRDADAFRVFRLKNGSSPVSSNIEMRTIRAAFNTAVRWNMITGNPWRGIKPLRIPEEQPTFFTREEFTALLAVIKEDWLRELVIVAVSTGLRRGELLNLKWSDVDFATGVIHVRNSSSFKTKTGRQRAVPMNETIAHLLTTKVNKNQSPFVFEFQGKQIRSDFITHIVKKYVRLAGLNPKLHFHSLRHTFATWLVQEGISVYEVQKLLGHSSIGVTQIYAHLGPSQLHQAVATLAVRIGGVEAVFAS